VAKSQNFSGLDPFPALKNIDNGIEGTLEIVSGEFELRLSCRLCERLEKTQKCISLKIEGHSNLMEKLKTNKSLHLFHLTVSI
jgi:hypothetical protein